MSWGPTGEGQDVDPGGYDGTVWLWELALEDGLQQRSVRVKMSGTAMIARDVHRRVAEARDSQGQTEVLRILDWNEPPGEIELDSKSRTPRYKGGDRDPEIKEIADIVDWFDEREIVVMFTGRGVGAGPKPPAISTWAANLLDLEKDELVNRFEAPTRLDAARAARAWWHKKSRPQTVEIGTATETDIALPIKPIGGASPKPEITPEQSEQLRRLHISLVWTAPTPGDPNSDWMIEVLDQDARLIGIAVQREAQDALLTVFEDLLPPGEPT